MNKYRIGISVVFDLYGIELKCKRTGVYFRPLILNSTIWNQYLNTSNKTAEPKRNIKEDMWEFLNRKAKTLLPKSEITIPCRVCRLHLDVKVCFLTGMYYRSGWQSLTKMTVHLPLCSNHYDAVIRNKLRLKEYHLILDQLRTSYHVQFTSWFIPKSRGTKKLNKS